jgi:integrase/recombinase XerD
MTSPTTSLAPLMQGFFTDRLMRQMAASPHTVASYRDTIKLLIGFCSRRAGRSPASLTLADVDAPAVVAFLQHLETDRGNTASTRNTRRAAIHSFFGYAALCAPEQAALIAQVLAIPPKRAIESDTGYLTAAESQALLNAPDQSTWHGRRDYTLLLVALRTGLRVSELIKLNRCDVHLGTGPHLRVHGKGRKDRAVPLTPSAAAALRAWLAERGGQPSDPAFPTRHSPGNRLSRDAIALLVSKHAAAASAGCPPLRDKRTTPHTLRHSLAMDLLGAGVDSTVIALFLGHESTQSTKPYIHADMRLKQQALKRLADDSQQPARFEPPDALLTFLESL